GRSARRDGRRLGGAGSAPRRLAHSDAQKGGANSGRRVRRNGGARPPRGGTLVRRSAALFLRVMLARAYPRVICLRRMPSWVLLETSLAVLSVCAFALVYRTLRAPEEYVGFVILGGVMTAFWLNVLWSMGAQFYWDRDSGNLELFIMAP